MLGTIGPVRFSVARTREPWLLDADALVISVGQSLGQLGRAVRNAVPDADWDTIPFSRITPLTPFPMDLPGVPVPTVIAATPHPGRFEPEPTVAAVVLASTAAIELAGDLGLTTVALPLLATGELQLPLHTVAEQLVPAIAYAASGGLRSVREVIFVAASAEAVDAVTAGWSSITHVVYSDALAGGHSSDFVDATRGIPLAKDRLDVSPYVSMLATVIAARSTPMPLSIGVFGEWGSGKSYFMGLLREQIRLLAASENPTYAHEVVQISFNAWHYSDSNLWASLGAEIFEQLAGPRGDALLPERRDRLRAELTDRLEERRELRATADRAADEIGRLRAEIDDAVASRDLRARDLPKVVRDDPRLQQELDDALSGLGISDDVAQSRVLRAELDGTVDDARALRRAMTGRRGVTYTLIALVLLVTPAAVALFVPGWAARLAGTGLLASVTATLLGVLDVSRRARRGLDSLRGLVEKLRRAHREGARSDVAQTVDRLRQAETRRHLAEVKFEAVVSEVAELDRELAELSPGRRLYAFLAHRADSDTYRQRQGIISTVRRDFEQLVRLMNEWREGPQSDARTAIDRVVLYIDDLDRCSPRQVVDVLQAVHLLLALELFVVVVGVDPRWLVRSVSLHHDELLSVDGPRPADGRRGTPEDYLEKILNIPFALPSMGASSLRRVLQGLVDDERTGPRAATTIDERARGTTVRARQRATTPRPTGAVPPTVSGEIPIQPGSQVDQVSQGHVEAVPRPLAEFELDLLGELGGLIDSPRVAKRVMNLYRMLRSTRDLSDASTFLGVDGRTGEYEAVVVLLGILTLDSALSTAIFDARPGEARGGLMHRAADEPLQDFVADLEPIRHGSGWQNAVVGDIDPESVPQWSRSSRGVIKVSVATTLPDLRCLQRWAPRVRRFSFALSLTPEPSDS